MSATRRVRPGRAARTGAVALTVLLLFGTASPGAVGAQEVFERFAGRWSSTDESLGAPAISTLVWREALGGAFYEVDYVIGRDGPDGVVTVFAGRGLYRVDALARGSGSWADSNGALLPLSAEIDGAELVSTWGAEDLGRLGRTRYVLEGGDRLRVTDWIWSGDRGWTQFNDVTFQRDAEATSSVVSGVGGIFFRSPDAGALAGWYAEVFDIRRTPTDYETPPWHQEAGPTVFAPFPESTDYFGDAERQWMVNLRVRDLDEAVARLRARGIEVEVDPDVYPNGRFARTRDPDGNPIELWEPTDAGR